MTDEAQPLDLPPVLQFDPPKPVYRIAIGEEEERIITEPLKKHELEMKMPIAIPNPWKPEEERFLPGIAYGEGSRFFMEIGESYGVLEFHEEAGWQCVALVPKVAVSLGLLKQEMEKKQGSYTQRLLKKTGKKG